MVAGDVNLSKGPEDEFECDIEDVKPGMWTVTCIWLSEEDVEGYNGDEEELGGDLDDSDLYAGRALKIVMRHSDFDSYELRDPSWEDIGSFSVDSGVWGIFSLQELEKAIEGSGDRESALECLADWAMDEGPKSPAGIAGEFSTPTTAVLKCSSYVLQRPVTMVAILYKVERRMIPGLSSGFWGKQAPSAHRACSGLTSL